MSSAIMMPNSFEISIKTMLEDAVTQAVVSLAEKHGFDQEEALRDLNISDMKLVHKRGPSPKTQKVKGKKTSADKSKTKRGTTGYIMFSKEERPAAKLHLENELEDGAKLKPQDTIRELGTRWKALSSEEQSVWNEKANEANSASASLVSSDVGSLPTSDEDHSDVEKKITKKKEKKADAEPKEKKKPSGYLMFAADARPSIKAKLMEDLADGEKVPGPALMAAVAAAWKALDDDERKSWNDKSKGEVEDEK